LFFFFSAFSFLSYFARAAVAFFAEFACVLSCLFLDLSVTFLLKPFYLFLELFCFFFPAVPVPVPDLCFALTDWSVFTLPRTSPEGLGQIISRYWMGMNLRHLV
jgi:hypothetical protein